MRTDAFLWSGLLLKIFFRFFCPRWKCYLGKYKLSSWRCYYSYLAVFFFFESDTSCGVSVPLITPAHSDSPSHRLEARDLQARLTRCMAFRIKVRERAVCCYAIPSNSCPRTNRVPWHLLLSPLSDWQLCCQLCALIPDWSGGKCPWFFIL
jgi:hypothetical protein